MKEHFTILSISLIHFSKAMEVCNIDGPKALQACGIDSRMVKDQESRIEAIKFVDLIDYCNQEIGTNDFSIQVAKQFHPSVLHVLGYAMMSSNTLKDALARLAQYVRVISNAAEINLIEDEADLIFDMTVFSYQETKRKVLSRDLMVAFLSTIVQFSRELLDRDLAPKKVFLSYPAPAHDTHYLNDFFKCDVEFDAATSQVIFDLQQANTQLMSGNPLITQTHEKMLNEFLGRVNKDDLTHVIITKICDVLPLGAPTQTEIANQLHMSLRNLQRKLQDEGTSYKDILDNTRKKLTLGYMKQKHLSLSEISYLVGFVNQSNFNRAFKRWTNKKPGEYRSQQLETD